MPDVVLIREADRLGARTRAKLCWAGELEMLWRSAERTRVLRWWISRREQLIRARSRDE